MLGALATGSLASVAQQLQALQQRTQADEFIVACAVHDHAARLRSYQLLAEVNRQSAPAGAATPA